MPARKIHAYRSPMNVLGQGHHAADTHPPFRCVPLVVEHVEASFLLIFGEVRYLAKKRPKTPVHPCMGFGKAPVTPDYCMSVAQ